MSERLVDMVVTLEDTDILHEERINGDPNREPDETTEDDVILAMMLEGFHPDDILGYKDHWTRAYRIMRKLVDPQG